MLQPYYDLAKLFRKEALAPQGAGWFFLAAPVVAVAAYLTVPLLIPVLTTYGLPLGYMGDILGGGFMLRWPVSWSLRRHWKRAARTRSSARAGRRRSPRSPSRWCCSSCSRWRC